MVSHSSNESVCQHMYDNPVPTKKRCPETDDRSMTVKKPRKEQPSPPLSSMCDRAFDDIFKWEEDVKLEEWELSRLLSEDLLTHENLFIAVGHSRSPSPPSLAKHAKSLHSIDSSVVQSRCRVFSDEDAMFNIQPIPYFPVGPPCSGTILPNEVNLLKTHSSHQDAAMSQSFFPQLSRAVAQSAMIESKQAPQHCCVKPKQSPVCKNRYIQDCTSQPAEERNGPKPKIALNKQGGYALCMAVPGDYEAMTFYQFTVRSSLEYFTAVDDDVSTTVQGRRQRVRPHQVGIRCRFCSHLPVVIRTKAAVYYPRSLMNMYQGAQNIACAHFQHCPEVPEHVLQIIQSEKPRRDFSKVGKPYWVQSSRELGIYEADNALWLR